MFSNYLILITPTKAEEGSSIKASGTHNFPTTLKRSTLTFLSVSTQTSVFIPLCHHLMSLGKMPEYAKGTNLQEDPCFSKGDKGERDIDHTCEGPRRHNPAGWAIF